jgi:hypothetical protein
MSIREGDARTPGRPGRGLLVGLLIVAASAVTFVLLFVYLWDWHTVCTGGDGSDGPMPGSGQARMCDAWDGNVSALYWIVAGLGLAIAVTVGVAWVRARVRGAWVLVAVALMVLSPILVAEYLTSPSGLTDEPVRHERSPDGPGRR